MGRGASETHLAPRTRMRSGSSPTTFYHVAPKGVQEHIQGDKGLWAGTSPDLDEQGVYVFDNLKDAQRFQSFFATALGETDIWSLELQPSDIEALTEDPREPGGWLYEEPFLEPQELALVQPTA